MSFEPGNPSLRDAQYRKGEFRETARDIVWKDRENKKIGRSADTGGAISRAMEAAYKLGLAHGSVDVARPSANPEDVSQVKPVAWNTIPPRPRSAFEQILQFNWIVVLAVDAHPWQRQSDRWACYWEWGEEVSEGHGYKLAHTFSRSTLAPIVRLGLMKETSAAGRTLLEPTPLAAATWSAAIAAGHVRYPSP